MVQSIKSQKVSAIMNSFEDLILPDNTCTDIDFSIVQNSVSGYPIVAYKGFVQLLSNMENKLLHWMNSNTFEEFTKYSIFKDALVSALAETDNGYCKRYYNGSITSLFKLILNLADGNGLFQKSFLNFIIKYVDYYYKIIFSSYTECVSIKCTPIKSLEKLSDDILSRVSLSEFYKYPLYDIIKLMTFCKNITRVHVRRTIKNNGIRPDNTAIFLFTLRSLLRVNRYDLKIRCFDTDYMPYSMESKVSETVYKFIELFQNPINAGDNNQHLYELSYVAEIFSNEYFITAVTATYYELISNRFIK